MAVERADGGAPPRPARLRAEANGARIYLSDWRALLEVVPECDLLCVDAPYSERTHAGHDGAVEAMRLEGEEKRIRVDKRSGARYSVGVNRRQMIDYDYWTPEDVRDFVQAWHPRVRGWFTSITDDTLAPIWKDELRAVGRYVFASIPLVTPGATVRLAGDGPSSWTAWLIVARTAALRDWGTLPGAYVLPRGQSVDLAVTGGKQPWHLQQIVSDYSRPGDLVCDPCCGAGTALIAAIRCGLVDPSRARRAVGGDIKSEHVDFAATWIQAPTLETPRGQKVIERQMELIPRRRAALDEERI